MAFDPADYVTVFDASPVRAPEKRYVQGESLLWSPPVAAGVPVTERSALKLSSLLTAVIVVATDVAALPLNVYRRRKDGGRDAQPGHPVEELYNVSPDGEAIPLNWRQALMGHALLWGTGYAEVQRTGRGTPTALHILPPESTQPRRIDQRLVYALNNGRALDHGDVLKIAGFGYDGLCGHNLVWLLNQVIGLGLAQDVHSADYYGNGAQPGVMLEFPGRLPDGAAERLRQSWNDLHRGPGRGHRVAVLEQGVKATPYTHTPEAAQLVESRKYQAVDAVRPWRVPPHKWGDYSEAHLANIEASNLDYLMTALMPWLLCWEQESCLKLLSRAERAAGYYVEHNTRALLRGDITSRFAAYHQALADGWVHRDQVRRWENLDPIGEEEGGLKYLVQVNQTTLEAIGEPDPEPDATDPSNQPDPADDTPSATAADATTPVQDPSPDPDGVDATPGTGATPYA
jgi:HK97 family phage portal protein